MIADIRPYGEVAFDTETTGVRPFEGDRICAFSLYHPKVGSCFVPIRMQGLGVENLPESTIHLLAPLFDGTVINTGHNLSHDINFIRVEGMDVSQIEIFDTQYGSFLFDDSLPSFKLKGPDSVTETILGDMEASKEKDLVAIWLKGHPGATYDFIPIELLGPYAEKDVILAWRVKEHIRPLILERGPPYDVLLPKEMEWVKLITGMGSHGILFDFDRATEIERSHTKELMALQEEFAKECWPGFNPNSWKMVTNYLNQNDIDPPDTEVGTLWLYTKELPIVRKIIDYRRLSKVLNSYIRPWRKQALKGGGRIYASWGATGHGYGDDYGQTRTGRLRARQPPLMAVPVYDSEVHREKEVFIAPEGWVFGAVDLSQVELRVATHYAKDEKMLKVLNDPDGDIHSMVAEDLGMPRVRAKRVVFGGGLYGAGDKKMAKTMTDELHELVTEQQAGKWLRDFRMKYPRFKATLFQVEAVTKSRGALILWNRRWMWFGPQDDYHKAWDWLIQGGVAALVKVWMGRINEYLQEHKMRSRICLQIHDEVILEMPKEEVHELARMAALVEGIGPEGGWRCPIFYQIKTGDRWSDLR